MAVTTRLERPPVLSALRSCHDLDYRARPKTDRIACPWLIRRFIDPDATIVYVPADQVLTAAAEQGAHSFDAPGDAYTYQAARTEPASGAPLKPSSPPTNSATAWP
jgi:hypothetical protein